MIGDYPDNYLYNGLGLVPRHPDYSQHIYPPCIVTNDERLAADLPPVSGGAGPVIVSAYGARTYGTGPYGLTANPPAAERTLSTPRQTVAISVPRQTVTISIPRRAG